MGSHVFVSHAWPGSGMVLSMMAYFTGAVMLGAFGECLSVAHLDVLPHLNWHWRIVSSPGCHYMPSHSIAICVRIIAAGCKRRKYGNTKSQGCKVKVVLSKLLMLDDASEGVHISKQSLRQSIHQHHDRHVRRRCISMTLSSWQVVTPPPPRVVQPPHKPSSRHTLDCSLLQSTHQHHDRDVKRRCIWMTLSRKGFPGCHYQHHDRDVRHTCIRMTLPRIA